MRFRHRSIRCSQRLLRVSAGTAYSILARSTSNPACEAPLSGMVGRRRPPPSAGVSSQRPAPATPKWTLRHANLARPLARSKQSGQGCALGGADSAPPRQTDSARPPGQNRSRQSRARPTGPAAASIRRALGRSPHAAPETVPRCEPCRPSIRVRGAERSPLARTAPIPPRTSRHMARQLRIPFSFATIRRGESSFRFYSCL